LLLLVSVVVGGIGEVLVPSTVIVDDDASATARNILAHGMLFRLGFACYLVEAICDVALTPLFYLLLKPVRRDLALLAAAFRLVATSTFAISEVFYFAALLIAGNGGYLHPFSSDQRSALALLVLDVFGTTSGIFTVFYGSASIVLGYLIVRSRYLPKALGVLLSLAGLAFVIRNFLLVLAPEYAADGFLAPMLLAMSGLGLWLLAKGVDVRTWQERTMRMAEA
jgi:hypothetical protein